MGQEKGDQAYALHELSHDNRVRRRRPGAASSAERQQFEVHCSFRRYAARLEERGR